MILIPLRLDVNPEPVTVAVELGGPLVGDTVMTGVAFTVLNPTAAILAQRIDIISTETYLFKFIPRSKLLLLIYKVVKVQQLRPEFNDQYSSRFEGIKDAV